MSCSAMQQAQEVSTQFRSIGQPRRPTDIQVTVTANIGGATIPPCADPSKYRRLSCVIGARVVLKRFERDCRAERRILAADKVSVKGHR